MNDHRLLVFSSTPPEVCIQSKSLILRLAPKITPHHLSIPHQAKVPGILTPQIINHPPSPPSLSPLFLTRQYSKGTGPSRTAQQNYTHWLGLRWLSTVSIGMEARQQGSPVQARLWLVNKFHWPNLSNFSCFNMPHLFLHFCIGLPWALTQKGTFKKNWGKAL